MKTKNEINDEAKEIYFAIKELMNKHNVNYAQSWWLNPRNFNLKSRLKTPQVVQRCKLLIKQGYLIIDKSNTSTSSGTSYKLTNKDFI